MEIRSNKINSVNGRTASGYAAVFNASTKIADFTEIIQRGAFSNSLATSGNIAALYQHSSNALLGTTQAKTLKLFEDDKGLRFELELPNTTVGNDIAELIKRGDIAGCSFGFQVRDGGEIWEDNKGEIIRTLTDLDLHEITLCHNPAYKSTELSLRSQKIKQSNLARFEMWIL